MATDRETTVGRETFSSWGLSLDDTLIAPDEGQTRSLDSTVNTGSRQCPFCDRHATKQAPSNVHTVTPAARTVGGLLRRLRLVLLPWRLTVPTVIGYALSASRPGPLPSGPPAAQRHPFLHLPVQE